MKIMIVRELDIYFMSHLDGLYKCMNFNALYTNDYSHYKFDVVMLLQYTFVCCYYV